MILTYLWPWNKVLAAGPNTDHYNDSHFLCESKMDYMQSIYIYTYNETAKSD